MKVIKLNRRYKVFREHGFQAGLRFVSWNEQAKQVESACRVRMRSGGWTPIGTDWYGYFGKAVTGPRPYFIMFRRESDLTLVLLSVPT